VQKTSFYTITGILQCKNRDCPAGIENFGRSAEVVIPLPPTDHFSATSLKILFARIDRGSDRVVFNNALNPKLSTVKRNPQPLPLHPTPTRPPTYFWGALWDE